MKLDLRLIEHGSALYDKMIDLRVHVLLNPIGVAATYIEKEKEKNDILIGAFNDNVLVGCSVLSPISEDVIQLRQMAVLTNVQGQGVGAAIVDFAEKTAISNNFKILKMHARAIVADFYKKCGYKIYGNEFEEVGIRHYTMKKRLQ